MSVWYAAEGVIKVRACDEAKQLVENYMQYGELYATYDDAGDGTAEIVVQGGTMISNLSAEWFDHRLAELGQYAIDATLVKTQQDDETSTIYVGPVEEEEKTKSADALEAIKELAASLTSEDRKALSDFLNLVSV